MRGAEVLVGAGLLIVTVWAAMGCRLMAQQQWPEAAKRKWFDLAALLAGFAVAILAIDGLLALSHARRERLQQAMEKAHRQINRHDATGARLTLENAIEDDNRDPAPRDDIY